jgi:hypothetical protein
MEVQIIGIRKPGGASNTHSAISHYQWRNNANGESKIATRPDMVKWILSNPTYNKAYVQGILANTKAYCKVVTNAYGTTFLETYPNSTGLDNLLSLPNI